MDMADNAYVLLVWADVATIVICAIMGAWLAAIFFLLVLWFLLH